MERELVAHPVVQVAGDAQALLGDPAPGLPLAVALRAPGPLLDLGQVRAAVPGRVAGRHGKPTQRSERQVLRAERRVRVDKGVHGTDGQHHQPTDE
jgi:hypothetical protein